MEPFSRRFELTQVVSCCVYEILKQLRHFVMNNNQICLTIGQILLHRLAIHFSFENTSSRKLTNIVISTWLTSCLTGMDSFKQVK